MCWVKGGQIISMCWVKGGQIISMYWVKGSHVHVLGKVVNVLCKGCEVNCVW